MYKNHGLNSESNTTWIDEVSSRTEREIEEKFSWLHGRSLTKTKPREWERKFSWKYAARVPTLSPSASLSKMQFTCWKFFGREALIIRSCTHTHKILLIENVPGNLRRGRIQHLRIEQLVNIAVKIVETFICDLYSKQVTHETIFHN